MQIRRFEAKNMTAALRHIKEELGAEAVILSARSLRKGRGILGSLKYAGVEVTAAVDTKLPAAQKGISRTGVTGDAHDEKSGPRFVRSARSAGASPAGGAGGRNLARRQARQRKKTDAGSENRKLSGLYQQLRTQDVERSIVSELVEEIKHIPVASEALTAGDLKSHLISLLEEMGVATNSIGPGDTRRGIHALIGTCGVGKTTTIAKLAARLAIRENRSVGLITMDN